MTDYVHPEGLVDTDWLEQRLDDASIRIVEVDEDTSAYEKGHIRNAVGWNWTTDLHDPLRRDYVDLESLSRLMQQAGVDSDTTVVLYGGKNNWFGAYSYWLLRYPGVEPVKLLKGGRKKGAAGGRAVGSGVGLVGATGVRG